MLENSFCMLKGISATGKGTRVSQLQEFLKSKFKYEIIKHEADVDRHGNSIPISVFFPELNLNMLGKWVKSNKSKLYSWNSLDFLHSLKNEPKVPALFDKFSDTNIMAEGYPVCISKRYHIKTLVELHKFSDVFFGYYIFPYEELRKVSKARRKIRSGKYTEEDIILINREEDNKQLMQQRVFGRSGSFIRGTCWTGNPAADREYEMHKSILIDGKIDNTNVTLYKDYFDVDLLKFGREYLTFLGRSDLIKEFEDWSSINTTLRHVDNREQNEQYLETYLNQ